MPRHLLEGRMTSLHLLRLLQLMERWHLLHLRQVLHLLHLLHVLRVLQLLHGVHLLGLLHVRQLLRHHTEGPHRWLRHVPSRPHRMQRLCLVWARVDGNRACSGHLHVLHGHPWLVGARLHARSLLRHVRHVQGTHRPRQHLRQLHVGGPLLHGWSPCVLRHGERVARGRRVGRLRRHVLPHRRWRVRRPLLAARLRHGSWWRRVGRPQLLRRRGHRGHVGLRWVWRRCRDEC
mmetsp:Transcript_19754/g.59602  ORF Transcript_19754/g.59602 Transcript_19754/m.59602 type:complete len:233 (-) Transcript_19754:426-1124(-)